ncbi:hypothetical protein ACFCXT_25505 [Streptomyces vinaceus]|uniref:hypothetical protein n=1 Tax=Streptomyces vinaceus TaxID=1960 RepID=UPI0035DB61ED
MRWTVTAALGAALFIGGGAVYTASETALVTPYEETLEARTAAPDALAAAARDLSTSRTAPQAHGSAVPEPDEDSSYAPPGGMELTAAAALTGGVVCVTYAIRLQRRPGRAVSGSRPQEGEPSPPRRD